MAKVEIVKVPLSGRAAAAAECSSCLWGSRGEGLRTSLRSPRMNAPRFGLGARKE